MLQTPLAAAHEALGGRMVPFSGWLMPVQYEGIVAEHLHTRSAAGLFDLSHMGRLHIDGPDAATLIQRATTNDVERLTAGATHYTLICNEQGGVDEDLLVYRFPDTWRLVVNASNRVKVLGILDALREALRLNVQVCDDTFDLALLGLQGPAAEAVLQPLIEGDLATLRYYHGRADRLFLGAGGTTTRDVATQPPAGDAAGTTAIDVVVSRTGYTGEDGFEVMAPAARVEEIWNTLLVDARVRPVGLGARDTLRLEAGMALYGHELTDAITPYEARLERVVRLDKGEFRGRTALEALHGEAPARLLVGLSLEAGAVPRAGFVVTRDGAAAGEVASGTFSPTLRRPIATAYVSRELAAPDTALEVAIRGGSAPARVVPLPFVPHQTKRRAPQP